MIRDYTTGKSRIETRKEVAQEIVDTIENRCKGDLVSNLDRDLEEYLTHELPEQLMGFYPNDTLAWFNQMDADDISVASERLHMFLDSDDDGWSALGWMVHMYLGWYCTEVFYEDVLPVFQARGEEV